MDFAYTAEDEAFRDELVDWLDEHLPKFLAEWSDDERRRRRRRRAPAPGGIMAADGAPPGLAAQAERGPLGRHLLARASGAAATRRSPRTSSTPRRWPATARPGIYNANGLWQIGPMIIRWGTDEQKERWIPNILNADDHWCQGFTEPEAGSDLANLRTHGRRATATTTCSTARRSGSRPPTSPGGACSSCAPTPTPSPRAASTTASPR